MLNRLREALLYLWRAATNIKTFVDWLIFAGWLGFPGVSTAIAFYYGQTFDVVFLYLLAGIAFWYAVKEQLRHELDPSPRTRRVTISGAAKELLCAAAAQGGGGRILIFSVNIGDSIQTENRVLNDPNDHRDTARWRTAIDDLASLGLIQKTGYDPVIYELQESGYEAADQICGPKGKQ